MPRQRWPHALGFCAHLACSSHSCECFLWFRCVSLPIYVRVRLAPTRCRWPQRRLQIRIWAPGAAGRPPSAPPGEVKLPGQVPKSPLIHKTILCINKRNHLLDWTMWVQQFWDVSHPQCERGSVNVVGAPVEVTVACCLCVGLGSQSLSLQSLLQTLGHERKSQEQKWVNLVCQSTVSRTNSTVCWCLICTVMNSNYFLCQS